MISPFKAGYFQTWEWENSVLDETTELLIRDEIYGDHSISDPILIELLLRCPAVLRLQGICQHGITGFLGHTHRVTRLEHSVGAFLLVRSVGGSLSEQVSALLHDVSHTTLSHVIDWVMTEPRVDENEGGKEVREKRERESFHEIHKARYINSMTDLPKILAKYGLTPESIDENLFPLVEKKAPHLCADRLDYALRDAVGFGKLSLHQAQSILASLRAFPDVSHPHRFLVLTDADLALALARAYLATDCGIWSNRAHLDMYRRTADVIRTVLDQGRINEKQLWQLSDKEFWALLRTVADPQKIIALDRLESEGLPHEDNLALPRDAKVRTLDPDVYLKDIDEPLPLSAIRPSWAAELKQYIFDREATRA